jgi:HTH-type transcriptional regulator / antitoxin MqsA
MKTENITCPVCETGGLVKVIFSDDFPYNNKTVHVDNLEGCVCKSCGADPILKDQIKRNHQRIADAKRASDGMLIGQEIKKIREYFKLTQRAAAKLFGGGANAFSKYERGDVIQSESMDSLMWLIMEHSYLINDLKLRKGFDLADSTISVCDHTRAPIGRCATDNPRLKIHKMRPSVYECVIKDAKFASNIEIDNEKESAAA